MDQRRVTNALLFVIAVCLVLIVVHLYRIDLAQPVEAQERARPDRVELFYKRTDGLYYPLADEKGRLYIASPQN